MIARERSPLVSHGVHLCRRSGWHRTIFGVCWRLTLNFPGDGVFDGRPLHLQPCDRQRREHGASQEQGRASYSCPNVRLSSESNVTPALARIAEYIIRPFAHGAPMFAKNHALLAILLSLLGGAAIAGPDIDVVYGDDIAHRGELAGELATRWSQSARSSELGGRSIWQAQGELAYGVSDFFNVGIKLPATRSDGRWRGNS